MQESVLPSYVLYLTIGHCVAQAGLDRYPYFDKLWLMLGQLEERQGAAAAARQAYQNGLKRCITSVPLWRVRCYPMLNLHLHGETAKLVISYPPPFAAAAWWAGSKLQQAL